MASHDVLWRCVAATSDSMVQQGHLNLLLWLVTRKKIPEWLHRVFIGCQRPHFFSCYCSNAQNESSSSVQHCDAYCKNTMSLQAALNCTCARTSAGRHDTNSDITKIFTRPFQVKEICFVWRVATSHGSEENSQTDLFSLLKQRRQAGRQKKEESTVCVCVCVWAFMCGVCVNMI